MSTKRTIAIDLDGTICEYKQWRGIDHFGKPLKKVRKCLAFLQKMGFEIIIYTTRMNWMLNDISPLEALKLVKNFLAENQIPYDSIFAGPGKPLAELYIDDRAVEFKGDWEETLKEVLGKANVTDYKDFKGRS